MKNVQDDFHSTVRLCQKQSVKREPIEYTRDENVSMGGLRTIGCQKSSYEKRGGKWWMVQEGRAIKEVDFDENITKDYDKLPLVSIVTVVYNGEKYIEETIESIINQSYPNIEYIIVDGRSMDGTLDIIKKYEDKIDLWISQEDSGMYQALNKGFKAAKGDIFAYLNSDDLYYDKKVIEKVVRTFNEEDVDLVFGDVQFIDENSDEFFQYKSFALPRELIRYLARIPFLQPSTFWKREVYERVDGFDERLKYVADAKFFFQVLLDEKVRYQKVDHILSKFRIHPEAYSSKLKIAMKKEFDMMKQEISSLLRQNILMKVSIEAYIKAMNMKNIAMRAYRKSKKSM